MRQRTLFAALALVAITSSAAGAQSRIYRSGASGAAFTDNPNNRGGASSSAPVTLLPAQTATTPATTTGTRPTFIAIDPQQQRQFGRGHEFHGHHFHGNNQFNTQPYYPPYVYPPSDEDYYTNYTSFTNQQQQPTEQVAEPQSPAPTIFENRPGYQAPPVRMYQPTSEPMATSAPTDTAYPAAPEESQKVSAVDPQPTTILVFRDGHQLEIGNYAIVGDTLYNMAGADETHKILLSDLDLEKTVQVNRARGYDFRLPKRAS
jgi:hypothetical protein